MAVLYIVSTLVIISAPYLRVSSGEELSKAVKVQIKVMMMNIGHRAVVHSRGVVPGDFNLRI